METLPRITRRTAQKLLKEKSLPNRLQRLTTGGFKRKAVFLSLTENKRRKRVHVISPSTDAKSVEEEAQLKMGKINLSEYFVGNEEVQIFVELPVDQANTLEMIAEIKEFGSLEGLSDDGDHKPVAELAKESVLDCGLNGENEYLSFEFRPFILNLAFDTDSEDQNTMNLSKMAEGELQMDDEHAVTSKPSKFSEELDSVQSDVVQVFDKMPVREVEIAQATDMEMPDAQVLDKMAPRETTDAKLFDEMNKIKMADAQVFDEMNKIEMADAQVLHEMRKGETADAQTLNGSYSLLGHVKEEPEIEGSFPGLDTHKGTVEREGTCNLEQLKGLRRVGPGSKWLYSGSRFAAFLRSAVGVIDLDADEHLSQNQGKATAKQKLDAVEGVCNVASPPKKQSARFPGKRKVALSPSSQFKLLEASKSSSYRRMLPFCTELAKDLAMTSSAQSTPKMLPTADCIAPKACDMCTHKGLTRKSLLLEHIKDEDSESDLEFVTRDQGLSSGPISRAHVEPDQNGIQKELPTSHEEISREPQCNGCVKLEISESRLESSLSDEYMTMEPPCIGQVKVEENSSPMELASSDEDKKKKPLSAGNVTFKQNGFQMEFAPSNEEFSREPLATKHAKLKDNESHSVSAINNVLRSAGLSIGHVKLEQSASQIESVPSDQCLSRKSLFVEHVDHGQNGNQPQSATSDNSLSRESFFTAAVEPEQTECQLKNSNRLESSPACHLYGPSDLGKNVVSQSSSQTISLLFSNGQCLSPSPMKKSPPMDADNMIIIDDKLPSLSLSGSADFTLFATHGELPSPLHTPASVPSKGILKVSPRSCKGVCLCPDCASFRLQAERASEFSERQLRETEALAVALMNELANVRNVMDKFLITNPKGARILYSIPHSQLKDASKSALRAEETARSQLVQMTRNCNLHCKILRMQQRKVKFADK
ncbi:hypothetical protein KI387_019869, partial [Taxus chinensis]